ncbi:MAG: glycosyltransferase [Acidobacteria bacterium]|nr:glycosyltransferase [Acidobacteriota bacterium]
MIFIFFFLAAILIFLGWKSLRGGIDYLNFFKRELAKPKSNFTPFVSIIAPCRGVDEDLSINFSALFEQNYPNYEIIFVVDNGMDESVPIIKSLIREYEKNGKWKMENGKFQIAESPLSVVQYPFSSSLVISGKASDSSQKVHNLRHAVLEANQASQVFAFVDSDTRTGADWLRNLVAPLQNESVGCTTGYRWFIAKRGGIFSHLQTVWNASIASALGANLKNNFCWGGSMAIRRETFERLNIREKWRGTLSDDYILTKTVSEANLSIYFVPQCLTASFIDCTWGELLEFTTRQMKITRVYAPHLWKLSFIGSIFFSSIFWTGAGLLFFLIGWKFWLTFVFVSVIFALGACKAWIRLNAVKLILKNYANELNRQLFAQITLWTLTPILFFYNCLHAAFSRKIRWRGTLYELKSASETVIINGDD